MIFDRLTWIGFMIVALGWALLFSTPQLAELLASFTGRSMNAGYLNLPTIAFCTILTGFGVAILGALQTGFGALNNFLNLCLREPPNRVRIHAQIVRSNQGKLLNAAG